MLLTGAKSCSRLIGAVQQSGAGDLILFAPRWATRKLATSPISVSGLPTSRSCTQVDIRQTYGVVLSWISVAARRASALTQNQRHDLG